MGIKVTGGVKVPQGKFSVYTPPPPPPPKLWAWGRGTAGQLGLGDATNKSSPVAVGVLTSWTSNTSIGNYHTAAIKSDGTLWMWGDNSPHGELGQGDIIDRSSPVQVGSLTTWASVTAGTNHVLAIKTTGELWGWGDNGFGQLGLGNVTDYSSPVQVSALTDWSRVYTGGATGAIKTDGTLWTWGTNTKGQLAQNDIIARSSPVQVGSLTDWSKLQAGNVAMVGLQTNGTLWVWGGNNRGQLGQSDIIERSSPIQVGTSTNWTDISMRGNAVHAINSLGELWAWGSDFSGQLGVGTTTVHSSSPIQVGGTDWATIASGGDQHTHATRTDGTLWSWGQGEDGKGGHGNVTDYNSPVQVGSDTDWTEALAGGKSAFGLK